MLKIRQARMMTSKNKFDKTCVINDPLGQTHSPVRSDHYFHWKLFCFEIMKSGDGCKEGQAPRVKIVIAPRRDCGSAKWINFLIKLLADSLKSSFAGFNLKL